MNAAAGYPDCYFGPESSLSYIYLIKLRFMKMLITITAALALLQTAAAQKREEGKTINGKKEGLWLTYNEQGQKIDSTVYAEGHPKGISIGWYDGVKKSDSSNYDGAGNGFRMEWWDNGSRKAEGRLVNNTIKDGLWTYYNPSGRLMSNEEYSNGIVKSATCFDEAGKKLPPNLCVLKDASFIGGEPAWIRFLQNNLQSDVPVKKGAPVGTYTVVVQFIVSKDGSVADIKPLTKYGYGMEEEVVRIIDKSPRWTPAVMYNGKVNAYRKQPITFVVQEETRRRKRG